MLQHTTGVIALPQGIFYFLSLTTGQVLNWVHATPLPMPDDVIQHVETRKPTLDWCLQTRINNQSMILTIINTTRMKMRITLMMAQAITPMMNMTIVNMRVNRKMRRMARMM